METATLVCLIVGLATAALGLIMTAGKGWFLVAGLNTTPKELRDKLNVKGITRSVGKYLLFHAALIIAFGFAIVHNATISVAVLVTVVLASSIVLVIHLNKNAQATN
ncbi:MAG: DUF3784 domain-containing protein [Oscillospiraceae bacterium]|jgi:uncharacterized membrane protein|nr:DUF3784 domain-containing protein [Oscillospiraceae bacterium]